MEDSKAGDVCYCGKGILEEVRIDCTCEERIERGWGALWPLLWIYRAFM